MASWHNTLSFHFIQQTSLFFPIFYKIISIPPLELYNKKVLLPKAMNWLFKIALAPSSVK